MRLINADVAIHVLKELIANGTNKGMICGEDAVHRIEILPSVQPERKTGRWIDTGSGQECSECGEIQYGYDSFRKYCANCGAKMEGGEAE